MQPNGVKSRFLLHDLDLNFQGKECDDVLKTMSARAKIRDKTYSNDIHNWMTSLSILYSMTDLNFHGQNFGMLTDLNRGWYSHYCEYCTP